MKKCDALKLWEGDLIDLDIPSVLGGCDRFYAAKVLIVTSHGGIYFKPSNGELARWTWCRWVKFLGRREELTDRECAAQLWEIERAKAGKAGRPITCAGERG